MKIKTLVVIVAILAAVSLGVHFLNRPAEPAAADARIGASVLNAQAVEGAAKIRLSDQGKTVELAKAADGSWRVVSYHDLPADFKKLSRLIDDLTKAKIERLVTSRSDRLSRLEFKDTQVGLLDSGGKPIATISLGKSTESGSGRYLRFGDETKAYQAQLQFWLDVEARNWADAALLDFKTEDIAQVELALSGGARIVAKRAKKEDPFAAENPPAGKKLKAERIQSLLSTLSSLRFTDTSDLSDAAAIAAKKHAHTITLTSFDQKSITVAAGRKPEEKVLKKPEPGDGKSGPTSLGTPTDAKKPEETGPAKVIEPLTETIPAGPVYAFVSHSDPQARVNALMAKRACQVGEYVLTGLPANGDELFETEAPASSPPAPSPDAPK